MRHGNGGPGGMSDPASRGARDPDSGGSSGLERGGGTSGRRPDGRTSGRRPDGRTSGRRPGGGSGGDGRAAAPGPVLRVIRGDASPEELAALVSVLGTAARAGRPAPSGPEPTLSRWADRTRLLRRIPPPGPGAWRDSTRPGR
jgi:hypothetical protein